MVKEENVNFYNAHKYFVSFLNAANADPSIVELWKSKNNLHKFKNSMKQNNKQNFPLRPKSEYIYFCKLFRPQIQSEMMEEKISKLDENESKDKIVINIHEVTCKLGEKWQRFKNYPDLEIKKTISELAEADNKRYREEKKNMLPKEKDESKHLRSKYLFFCREKRLEKPEITMKNLGQEWAIHKNDQDLTERYEKICQEMGKEKK
jgi:hypothetical protein